MGWWAMDEKGGGREDSNLLVSILHLCVRDGFRQVALLAQKVVEIEKSSKIKI